MHSVFELARVLYTCPPLQTVRWQTFSSHMWPVSTEQDSVVAEGEPGELLTLPHVGQGHERRRARSAPCPSVHLGAGRWAGARGFSLSFPPSVDANRVRVFSRRACSLLDDACGLILKFCAPWFCFPACLRLVLSSSSLYAIETSFDHEFSLLLFSKSI